MLTTAQQQKIDELLKDGKIQDITAKWRNKMRVEKLECPECKADINVNDWFWNYAQKRDTIYYFTCKSCKIKLGSTLMLDGKVSIWNKRTEQR